MARIIFIRLLLLLPLLLRLLLLLLLLKPEQPIQQMDSRTYLGVKNFHFMFVLFIFFAII